MLASEQTNSSPVKKNSPFMETVQDKLKDIKNFSNWSAKEQMIAVGAVGVMVGALLPFVAVALPVAATGAIVALTLFFAVKAVEYTFKGLKWSAEKTVDGAKYTAEKVKDASTYAAGKVRDGAVHAKDKVKEGYEHSVNSLKKGASFIGEGVANKFHRASGKEDYSDKLKRFTEEENKKSDEIRSDLKEIFADKGNNFGLVKDILSGISSKIDSKIAEEAKSGWEEHTPKWRVQKEFINNLNKKSLHSLLTQRSLPKGSYFIDSVFSDHHDEIKEVIKECKENHLHSSVSNMFNTAERKANKPSLKSLTRSVSFSLLGKSPKQSASLSRSSSLNSIGTESTISSEAELLNPAEHKEVKAPSSLWDRVSSPFKSGKKSEKTSEVKYQVLSESDTLPRKIGNSTFYVDTPTPTENTDKTATIGGRPGVARRNSTSNLTRVGTPEVPTRSASLTNLNELNASSQNSLSEEFGSNPIRADNEVWYDAVTTLPGKGTLTRSNSSDSAIGSSGSSTPHGLDYLSFPDDLRNTSAKLQKQGYFGGQARQQATRTLREKQDYVVIDMEGYTDSIGYQSGSDSGRSSPGSSAHSTPTRQGLPSKEQFDKELGEKLAKRRAVLDGVSLEPITQKVTTV